MMKRITVLGATAALLLAVGSAIAHEGRSVGDYNFVVGFLYEPAYEGFQNGVSIRVTKPSDAGSHDDHTHGTAETGQDEGMHEHGGGTSHEAVESKTPVSLQVSAETDASGGVTVTIETEELALGPRERRPTAQRGRGARAHLRRRREAGAGLWPLLLHHRTRAGSTPHPGHPQRQQP